jgi:hypothetical protein
MKRLPTYGNGIPTSTSQRRIRRHDQDRLRLTTELVGAVLSATSKALSETVNRGSNPCWDPVKVMGYALYGAQEGHFSR